MDYTPDSKSYPVDELLVWKDLWVTAHIWGEPNDNRLTHWLNFRLIEHEKEEADGTPVYPTDPLCRPSRDGGTYDARKAGDYIAEGYLKWDGCMEIDLSHHCCGRRMWSHIRTAVDRIWDWANGHGFEGCADSQTN